MKSPQSLKNRFCLSLILLTFYPLIQAATYNISSLPNDLSIEEVSYTDQIEDVYYINTGTYQPITFDFDYSLEPTWDWFKIYSISNTGVETLVYEANGENRGSISTNLPTGRAKIEVHTDGSVCYPDYWGLYITINVTPYTFGTSALTNSNATIAGKLGVGVSNPVTNMHVVGTTDLSPSTHGLMVLGATNTTNIGIDQNEIMARNNGVASALYLNNEGGNVLFNGANASGSNVGIGTSSPTSILALSGTAARTIQMERNTTSATAGQGLTVSSGGAKIGTANLEGGDLSLKSGISTGTGASVIRFLTATAGTSGSADRTPSEKMTILGNGNVGIGTNAPDKLLTVKGIIHAQEVQVDVTGFADYVFEKGYKLKPLSEIHSFISENGHLPEIPSEDEVKKNGMNVADMQVMLLKKIEELTLYAIEQQKRIEVLEKTLKK